MVDIRPSSAPSATLPEADQSLLAAVWRRRLSVVVVVLLGALVGFAVSTLQPVRYAAEARLFLATSRPFEPLTPSGQFVEAERYVSNQAAIASSSLVLERAESRLGGTVDAETLRRSVRADAAPNLDLVSITATAPTAEDAVARAQAVTSAYRELVEERVQAAAQEVVAEIDAATGALENELAAMGETERAAAEQQILDQRQLGRDVVLQASLYGDGLAIVEPPLTPVEPSQPRPVRNALVGAVLGLLAAAAFALYQQEEYIPRFSAYSGNRFRIRKEP